MAAVRRALQRAGFLRFPGLLTCVQLPPLLLAEKRHNHVAMVEGTHRKTLQGIAQVVMLAELAVNRGLDRLVPTE